MKKLILILFLLNLQICIFSQCIQDKAELVKYLDNYNIDDIEGIWTLNLTETIYYKGEEISKNVQPALSEWAIIKSDKFRFNVCDINVGTSIPFNAYFEKTAIPNLYTYRCKFYNPNWEASANIDLSNKLFFEYGYWLDNAYVQNKYGVNYNPGLKMYWHFVWTKKYPAEEDKSTSNEWSGNGTGFFIDKNGYIATNYHVIEDASEIEVDFIQNNEKKSFKAKVISSDKQNDLAIIKIEDDKFKPYLRLPYSIKTTITDVGSNVFTLGYPMALTVMGDEVKFTDGKISSKTGFQGDITTYQISVPVQPGNSGGPLIDYDGNIIGVVNAKIMAADNVSYAIKLAYLKNLIDVIPDNLILPNDFTISQKTLTEKIKIFSNYVVLIKIR
jgi:S1-C subfamily serine protease